MADEEAARGQVAEHGRLGIMVLVSGRHEVRLAAGSFRNGFARHKRHGMNSYFIFF